MNYEYLYNLKKNHPALRLLNADSAPFIISFLNTVFVERGHRPIKESEIVEKLDDYLYHLHSIHGQDTYPKTSKEYLEDWAGGRNSFLRKYYPAVGDEPEFDITPSSEKVIDWIKSLQKKEFVGTESRLLLIFRLLQELVNATEEDPRIRIAKLKQKRDEIDREIEQIETGAASLYDERQIKESYWRIEDESRFLLTDFREVEDNFRVLDRNTREKIATSSLKKSELLDEIFQEHDAIGESNQGRSFKAFWAFLMSPDRQKELDNLIYEVLELNEVSAINSKSLLPDLKYYLLDAGDKVKKTLNNLNEQLNKFLDEKIWLENRRIMDIIQSLEQKAVTCRLNPPTQKNFIEIDKMKPEIELPMMRGLFIPPVKPLTFEYDFEQGSASLDTELLYNQHYVDEALLTRNIRSVLNIKKQASLAEISELYPFTKGLSELIAYMVIASKDRKAIIETNAKEIIKFHEQGLEKKITIPLVIFTR